ncbi:BCCT family transporter, partial [Pseudomonas aeruginosa]
AGVLLLAGGLQGLQAATIAAALPFSLVLLLICYCLVKALHQEESALQRTAEPRVGARVS